MVMARSSVHRRDDTLDLVQVVPKVNKIILVFTTIIQEICLLVLTTINSLFARLGTDYDLRNQWFSAILEAMTTD